MAQVEVSALKTRFFTGAILVSADFTDLIDTGASDSENALQRAMSATTGLGDALVVESTASATTTRFGDVGVVIAAAAGTAAVVSQICPGTFGDDVLTLDSESATNDQFAISSIGRTLVKAETSASARDNLGIGTVATLDAGTSGADTVVKFQEASALPDLESENITHRAGWEYIRHIDVSADTSIKFVEVSIGPDWRWVRLRGHFTMPHSDHLRVWAKQSGKTFAQAIASQATAIYGYGVDCYNGGTQEAVYGFGANPIYMHPILNASYQRGHTYPIVLDMQIYLTQLKGAVGARPFFGWARHYGPLNTIANHVANEYVFAGYNNWTAASTRLDGIRFDCLEMVDGTVGQSWEDGYFLIEGIRAKN